MALVGVAAALSRLLLAGAAKRIMQCGVSSVGEIHIVMKYGN